MIRKIPADTDTFHYHNANPKGLRTSDCVIRAISAATGDSWEDTLLGLTETAIKHKLMPNDPACYGKYLEAKGWVKHPQPRHRNRKKYTGTEFCVEMNFNFFYGERIIAHIGGGHVAAILRWQGDYKVHDTWNSTKGCVGNWWSHT